jgi:hypothetical protein
MSSAVEKNIKDHVKNRPRLYHLPLKESKTVAHAKLLLEKNLPHFVLLSRLLLLNHHERKSRKHVNFNHSLKPLSTNALTLLKDLLKTNNKPISQHAEE